MVKRYTAYDLRYITDVSEVVLASEYDAAIEVNAALNVKLAQLAQLVSELEALKKGV